MTVAMDPTRAWTGPMCMTTDHTSKQYQHDRLPYRYIKYSLSLSFSHDLYTVSKADFHVPEIRLEYGFPDHEPQIDTPTHYEPSEY